MKTQDEILDMIDKQIRSILDTQKRDMLEIVQCKITDDSDGFVDANEVADQIVSAVGLAQAHCFHLMELRNWIRDDSLPIAMRPPTIDGPLFQSCEVTR